MTPRDDEQSAFYAAPSPTSAVTRHESALPHSDKSIDAASSTACNAVIHVAAVGRMRLKLPKDRFDDLNTRSAACIIDRVLALNPAPLDTTRSPGDRMVGNCHHITLLTCALLRRAGVPARARAGFASYLDAGKWTDHWVCEVRAAGRWHRFDPDGRIDFDTDRRRRFLTGGEAWGVCRERRLDSDLFGFEDARGWWFIRNNVVRDFAALCKVELLPWDFWGLMIGQDSDRPDERIDELASMCADDDSWRRRVKRFEIDALLNPNGRVLVFRGGTQEVALPEEW